jgi:hypothetical protein
MRVVEPDDTEIGLAAELEFTAQRMGVSLDSGESLLCAIVVRRSLDFLVTGDKRAIRALAQILAERSMIDKLAGRVVCLEQLMIKVLASGVFSEVRNAICKNAKIDRALAICFSCSREDVTLDQVGDGLQSYVADLRRDASSIMCP